MSILKGMKRGEERSLNGQWSFLYTSDLVGKKLPSEEEWKKAGKMNVPGYWDDHSDAPLSVGIWQGCLRNPDYVPIKYPMIEGKDSSLPYIIGCGWYRCDLGPIEEEEDDYSLWIEGVMSEVWVWLNEKLLVHQKGYGIPLNLRLHHALKKEENKLIIAVSNRLHDWLGCSTRGFQGFSGGITGNVMLRRHAEPYIYDFHVSVTEVITAQLQVEVRNFEGRERLQWRIWQDNRERPVLCGKENITGTLTEIDISTEKLKKWYDTTPELYWLEIQLYRSDELLDKQCRRVGFRKIECKERNLYLNGEPVYLRGATEHCYFPRTCTPPFGKSIYLENIHKIQKLGFNWLRFHTWLPNEAYLKAADEAGIMIQLEVPKGFSLKEWEKVVPFYGRHPSVIIFCGGNEDLLDEDGIEKAEAVANLVHQSVPDVLFSPMEALRGIEYGWTDEDLGKTVSQEPFQHNPLRLKRIKEFSDVLEPYVWGNLSYNAVGGNWKEIDRRLSINEKPCLTHEMGIYGGYMDTRLWRRYIGTRIGIDLMMECRKYLEEKGVLPMADIYYQNSCRRLALIRKYNMEMARKCENLCGYDFLGAIDYHWHRSGYTSGIMNEFYELKPGASWKEIRNYNAPDVLLLDIGTKRNFLDGEHLCYSVSVSVFGRHAIHEGKLFWWLEDDDGEIVGKGTVDGVTAPRGRISILTDWHYTIPEMKKPRRFRLNMQLKYATGLIENGWDIWGFPRETRVDDQGMIVHKWDRKLLGQLQNGARILLLDVSAFDTLPVSFQPMSAGRVKGQFADVLHSHPVWAEFPQDGYCDWQFFDLLQNAKAVVFENKDVPFIPILEIVSSHKNVVRQAAMFEYQIGKGVLFVCGLNIDKDNPAAQWLLECILNYMKREDSHARTSITVEMLARLSAGNSTGTKRFVTDEAFDAGAQLK